MYFLLIFLFSIIILSVNSSCNLTEFYPCACCDPIYHQCVHNAANIFSPISSSSVFKIFNPTCKLDTSNYCCVPKEFERTEIKNDNITLFNKHCKKRTSLHDPLDSTINTVISSCDPISKQCYNSKNPITPALLPVMPKRLSEIKILPPMEDKIEVTPIMSTFIIEEDDNRNKNLKKFPFENKRKMEEDDNWNKNLIKFPLENKRKLEGEEVTISIWVPESRFYEMENKNVNRAIQQFQSIWFLIFISIFIIFSN